MFSEDAKHEIGYDKSPGQPESPGLPVIPETLFGSLVTAF